MAKKVKFNEVVIILNYKGEQVWRYTSTQITSLIGPTKWPNVDEETLKDRLESCPSILDGATEFHTSKGTWKFKEYKPNKKKR